MSISIGPIMHAATARRVACLLCALMFATSAWATEIVGTGVVDGRKIEILRDGTWQFAEPLPENCQTVTSRIMLCAPAGKWIKETSHDADLTAQFRHTDIHYAVLVVETIGRAQGVNFAGLRKSILSNAANFIGVPVESIPVVEVEDTTLFGLDASTVSYFAEVDGLPILYRNSIVIDEDMTVQAMTFEVAKDITPFHRKLHAEFLEELRLRD